MAEMVAAQQVAPDAILNSKLIAYETEIQSLTADKLLLEQDLSDMKEKCQKLQHELQLSTENVDSMKNENQLLKKNLKTTDDKCQALQKTSKALESSKQEWQNEQSTLRSSEKQYRESAAKLSEELKQVKTQSAKDIGRLKNTHQQDMENLNQDRARAEHVLQGQIINLKAEITAMNEEHKDVVTSQATRLRNYEHQISILETRCNRLQMSLELSVKPKVTDINMENHMKQLEQEREQYIAKVEELQQKMSRAKISQHYDFRAKSLF